MQDVVRDVSQGLEGLGKAEWLRKIVEIADEHGYFQPLGKEHFAMFVEHGRTLLVTFETISEMRARGAEPLGWRMIRDAGWSHLCIACEGETWFRDKRVYGYFDRLVDEGFLEDFDNVIFYGAGSCGYAAAAFSVAAPGATVVAVQPQATLDTEIAGWDHRFRPMRRVDFSDRYGYAPDMIEAADRAFIVYDPTATLDAMHAALFRRANVTPLRVRRMSERLQGDLLGMQILYRMLEKAASGRLDARSFARLARTRRNHPPYLRSLLSAVEEKGRTKLAAALCRNVVSRMKAPRFARRLETLERGMKGMPLRLVADSAAADA